MITALFHRVSYLQYPFVLVSLYYYTFFVMSLAEGAPDWEQMNSVLVFFGIAISFSTLQDTSTTQNALSRRVWESPRKGKIALGALAVMTAFFMISGLLGFLNSYSAAHEEVSLGLIVLSIGLLGLLKAAIEMFENHRRDKNPS